MSLTGWAEEPMLECLASASKFRRVTITMVNKSLDGAITVLLPGELRQGYHVCMADMIAPDRVRDQNTFEAPDSITSLPLVSRDGEAFELPRHSIARIVLEK